MSKQADESVIEKIRSTHENIMVTIGFLVGCVLAGYFFTFSMFTDQGRSGLLWFQGISTILMVVLLYKLKHVAFFFTRLWLGRKEAYREAFSSLSVADLARK